MEHTSETPTSILDDWYYAHLDIQQYGNLRQRSKRGLEYMEFCGPSSHDYYSPLNPTFLLNFASPSDMQQAPLWLIRDGLVPLLWFFSLMPRPEPLRSRLIVDEELGAYVPGEWRPLVSTYSTVALEGGPMSRREPESGRKGLLLTGLAMEASVSIDHLKAQLQKIRDRYSPKELASMPVFTCFSYHYDSYVPTPTRQSYFTEFVVEITRSLGTKLVNLEWPAFESYPSWEGFEIVDFNEKYLIADTMFTHVALKRGARIFGKPVYKPAPHDDLVALSPYHGMLIRKLPVKEAASRSLKGKNGILAPELAAAMRSEANVSFPWPKWFKSFCTGSGIPE